MTDSEMKVFLEKMKLLPVVQLEKAEDAIPLGQALCKGGLPAAEVTFRTAAGEETIRRMKKEFPEMAVGAGTVVNLEQAKRAVDAGAEFIVSPGLNGKVVEYALDQNLAIFPGVCTPTEIIAAMEYGLDVVKFFPAAQYGGLATIKALAAPFPGMRFMPTGGVNAKNLLDFLSFSKIIACGGSWMVKGSMINEHNFSEIERLTAEAMGLIEEFVKEKEGI